MTLQIFVELCKNSYNTHNQNSAFAFAFTVFAFVFKLVAEYTIPQHHFKLSIFCKLSAILKILVTLTVLWVVVTLSDKWLCLKTELQLLQLQLEGSGGLKWLAHPSHGRWSLFHGGWEGAQACFLV